MPPRLTGDTQPCQDSGDSGREGAGHELMRIIQMRWGFESHWMIQRCICLGRMGKLAQDLFFHRTLLCSLASLYLNSIETKMGENCIPHKEGQHLKQYSNQAG